MMNWITDRLPTEADADLTGDVVVQVDHNQWDMAVWYNVPADRPWIAFKSADAAAAVTAPTSQHRRIVSIDKSDGTVMAVADDGTAWYLSADWSRWNRLPSLPKRQQEDS